LNNFNKEFFEKNAHRFMMTKRYTQKAHHIYGTGPEPISPNASSVAFSCRTPCVSDDDSLELEDKQHNNLHKNMLTNKMTYVSFYDEMDDNIIMQLEIKPIYMGHIINNIIKQIDKTESILVRKMQHILKKIYSEHFEFRTTTIDMDISNELNVMLLFWIKSSMFVGDETTNEINMKWKICNYKF
jgi:hypothetical protein